MNKYALEVFNLGRWEFEKDFSSLDGAKIYGLTKFTRDQWRVHDRTENDVAYVYTEYNSPSIYEELGWRSVTARQQRERMREVGSRQRQQQRDRLEERRQRASRFTFVGPRPSVLQGPDDYEQLFKPQPGPKVNWLTEGF